MIVDNGKYYLYRHIRLDTNEPFYIGRGTKPNKIYKSTEYSRAFSKKRNNFWQNIINKTNYKVEILLESDNLDFIKTKEVEFVLLYGRKNINTGTLVNLTDGGDGADGCVASEETKRKISQNNVSKGKFGKDNPKSKKVYQYDLDGNFIKEWNSLHCISRFFNSKEMPDKCLSGKSKSYKGFQWFYIYKGEKTLKYKKNDSKNVVNSLSKKVYQYNNEGKFIKEWFSLMDIKRELKIPTARISESCKRESHFFKGSFWYYEFQGNTLEKIPKTTFSHRPVLQYSKDEIFLQKFCSIKQALLFLNKPNGFKGQISSSCNSNLTAFGYKWKYSNDFT